MKECRPEGGTQVVLTGDVFLFVVRNSSRLKILCWDRDGYSLATKRLSQGRFQVPRAAGSIGAVHRGDVCLSSIAFHTEPALGEAAWWWGSWATRSNALWTDYCDSLCGSLIARIETPVFNVATRPVRKPHTMLPP